MPDIDRLRHWSHHRQLLGRRGTSLERALRAVIGVYSAHPSAPLSLRARVRSFSERAFFQLEEKRRALRVPAMRESVYLLPAGTARLAAAATLPPPDHPYWQKRYSRKGRRIPPAKYKPWRARVLKAARRPRTAAEIGEAARLPDAALKPVLNRMAFEGRLLRVGAEGLRSNAIRYVAASSWAGEHRLPGGDGRIHADSLAWLAGEYLRAFGPARVKDFQWWTGVQAAEASKAMAAHETIRIGDDHLLLASDRKAFEAFRRPRGDTLDLLPRWDGYTMGYAPDGRARFVEPEVQDRVYGSLGATGGNALGVLLVNGLAHGSWTCRFQGSRMLVSWRPFGRLSRRLNEQVKRQFDEIASLLGAAEAAVQEERGG